MNFTKIFCIALIIFVIVGIALYFSNNSAKQQDVDLPVEEDVINDAADDFTELETFAVEPNLESVGQTNNVDETLDQGLQPRKQLNPAELLPKDEKANAWAKVNPKGQGSLELKNFMEAGYHLGINTVGQSLRNANLQIRSEPANPSVPVSIWNNSTITSDTNRRGLEIGCKM